MLWQILEEIQIGSVFLTCLRNDFLKGKGLLEPKCATFYSLKLFVPSVKPGISEGGLSRG